jgi:multidrug efflux pump subunit AcrA (membrane-fusion protein)
LSRREKFALTVAGLVILLVSAAVATYMMKNRPQPERRKPIPSAQVVTVRLLAATTQQVNVPVMGTVVPATEVDLRSLVAGEVLWIHPEFVEGGIVKKGQTLVRIDPTEYELALIMKKAVLEGAILDLKTEEGRQDIARKKPPTWTGNWPFGNPSLRRTGPDWKLPGLRSRRPNSTWSAR